jgi:hypothetical protein
MRDGSFDSALRPPSRRTIVRRADEFEISELAGAGLLGGGRAGAALGSAASYLGSWNVRREPTR